jgi:hypothetical protein
MTAGLAVTAALAASPAGATTVFDFSTGNPDHKLGALSQPAVAGGHAQTETADDFITTSETRLTSAGFTGLIPLAAKLSDIKNVEIEIYRVFPGDSNSTRTANVTTRTNSPGDHEIAGDTRDGADGSLSFTTKLDDPAFTVGTTVSTVRGKPNEFTGGDGPLTGQEVSFGITFNDPLLLEAGHFFFRPEVELANGDFFWLSAPFPVATPGTPFAPDRQAWIRNDALAPDWTRIGADVTHSGPVNMAFSLQGVAGVPEPSTWALMIGGFGVVGSALRRRRRVAIAA